MTRSCHCIFVRSDAPSKKGGEDKRMAAQAKLFSREESRDFMSLFPDLVREITFEGPHKDIDMINKHLNKVRKAPL